MVESRKIYYTMGEVTEMFDVTPSLIRHWVSNFDTIKPARNKKGNRLFTPEDVEQLKLIYHLVKERGMTLSGAKRALGRGHIVAGSSLERDAKIMERLQHLRSMLVELRNAFKDGGDVVPIFEEDPSSVESDMSLSLRRRHDSDREGDAETRELFAFYEQRLF